LNLGRAHSIPAVLRTSTRDQSPEHSHPRTFMRYAAGFLFPSRALRVLTVLAR
jgi:hypothetical protein